MVSSRAYPSLERKPGGPDNWVERAGGLPSYIERIAKHLHYERGMTISHAIATAVNTVRRWAMMGKVAKYGDPNQKRVTPKTAALAAKAYAEWQAKRKAGKINLSEVEFFMIDLAEAQDAQAEIIDLAEQTCAACSAPATKKVIWADGRAYQPACAAHVTTVQRQLTAKNGEMTELAGVQDLAEVHGTGADSPGSATLPNMNLLDLAERAGKIEDPIARAAARQSILDLSSSIPPKRPRNGKAKDGRPSYKKQGKWGHGFVPLDDTAKEAKAKGSPIAMKRMNRLFGGVKRKAAAATGRAGGRSGLGRKKDAETVAIKEKSNPVSEKANDIAFTRHSSKAQSTNKPDAKLPSQNKEASKGARVSARVNQNWDEIPENLKTVRNGKKYVLAEFGGKGYLTEWVGGVKDGTAEELSNRKIMSSITRADALKLSAAELRDLVNNPRTPANVRAVLRKALKTKAEDN